MKYIRRHRGKKGRGTVRLFGKKKILILVCFLFAFSTFFSEMLLSGISPQLLKETVDNHLLSLIGECAEDVLSETETPFFQTVKDDNGQVLSAVADADTVNSVKTELLKRLNKKSDGKMDISVPAGSLTNIAVLNGRGFPVSFRLKLHISANVSVRTEFVSAGINQSCHRLMMVVSVDAVSQSEKFNISTNVETDFLLSETVILSDISAVSVKTDFLEERYGS